MTRALYIAANWKMNGSRETNEQLLRAIQQDFSPGTGKQLLVAAPFVYLYQLREIFSGTDFMYGAQNVSEYEQGAYTGEVSAAMLADLGCQFAIVGHSERRRLFGESDALVAKKFAALRAHNITPVLCLGETLDEHEAGKTAELVKRQLQAVLDVCGVSALDGAMLAYEPVWAIGTGKTASPEQAQEVHNTLRTFVARQSEDISQRLPILYGGSVNGENAAQLFEQQDIDGGLIGGASLKADSFLEICKVG